MPGPKSLPMERNAYDDDTLALRDGAKANRKSRSRLKARQTAFEEETKRPTAHGFDMHKPGSQNRNK